ncbi:taurine catabolism dioxygenase TauD [Cadophora sp. MPI-SDFR-AT-0126]|nr:taurine catabolism dioxygenase TauD [Leotiomycetes sp. MPI-SDFR-AT-0126]
MATAGCKSPSLVDRKQESITTADYFGFNSAPTSDVSSTPRGIPALLETGQVWTSAEFADETRFVVNLTEEDKRELDEALEAFKSLCLDGNLVDRSNFPLPRLQQTLGSLAEDIHNGKGFCILRGLEADRYCLEDSMIVFLGIQSYVAERWMRQDEVGNMLVHVTADPSNERLSKHVRHSTDTIPFHTDPDADILGFQTRDVAASGGKFVLASGHSIYNELVRIRPDIISTLAAPDWPFALPYFHQRPILYHHNGRVIFCFTRLALVGNEFYPRPSSIPSISPRQKEALDIINSIAEKNRLEITLQPGDIHFVNNLALLHRRDKFVDDAEHKRHLVRMHLRNEKLGWNIPDELKQFWDVALDEDREESWHIEPMPESFFPLKLGSH